MLFDPLRPRKQVTGMQAAQMINEEALILAQARDWAAKRQNINPPTR